MKLVLALETRAPAYFCLPPRNVYFCRSRTWITFTAAAGLTPPKDLQFRMCRYRNDIYILFTAGRASPRRRGAAARSAKALLARRRCINHICRNGQVASGPGEGSTPSLADAASLSGGAVTFHSEAKVTTVRHQRHKDELSNGGGKLSSVTGDSYGAVPPGATGGAVEQQLSFQPEAPVRGCWWVVRGPVGGDLVGKQEVQVNPQRRRGSRFYPRTRLLVMSSG